MHVAYRTENGQVIQARDAEGSYFYTTDTNDRIHHGGYLRFVSAVAALDSEDDGVPPPAADFLVDGEGHRLGECDCCGFIVPTGDVPGPDDHDAWMYHARYHARNCEWVATRADQKVY